MEQSRMKPFRCCMCMDTFTSFENVIGHSLKYHPSSHLKIKKIKLCEQTGRMFYATKDYNVIPENETSKGNTISLSSEPEKITIGQMSKREEVVSQSDNMIEDSSFNPLDTSPLGHTASPASLNSSNDIPDEYDVEKEKNMISEILPDVLKELQKEGLQDIFVKFHKLVADRKFPLSNIAFLLFLDIVKYYDCDSAKQLRYSENVKKFWVTGYKLFHGKFLRFMGGVRNTESNCVNFSVPDIKTLNNSSKSLLNNDIKPGVLTDVIELVHDQYGENTSLKICFDGKKINSGISELSGDVDLFGCESPPTLEEIRRRHSEEIEIAQKLTESFQSLVDLGVKDIPTSCLKDMHKMIQILSCRIREMREMLVTKERCVLKFKALGKPDWKKSKYQYVISCIQTNIYQLTESVKDCLQTIDRLGNLCAEANRVPHLYSSGSGVDLNSQENFICMNMSEDCHSVKESESVEQHVLKQRGKSWHELRKKAVVTGSSAFSALGLDGLSRQVSHFDKVYNNQVPKAPDALSKERMEYGTKHEIDGIATLTGKILPMYYSDLLYVEEGSYDIKHQGGPFCIVSPDGSLRRDVRSKAALGIEIKCPYPDKVFTTQQMYVIPKRYITQILCEMAALQCFELLFICYTEESTTVFKVFFSQKTWDIIWDQLLILYGVEHPKRPKRTNPNISMMKSALEEFLQNNVTFLCELPSVTAVPCQHDSDTGWFQYHVSSTSGCRKSTKIQDIPSIMFKARTCIDEAVNLCRKKATEVFLFLISDLNRIHHAEHPHALPLAYGFQGPSLTSSCVRSMLEKVLEACFAKQLDVKVFSTDGQWIKLVHTDKDGNALTKIQKQKQYWNEVQKIPKTKLQRFFIDINFVPHSPSLQDIDKCAEVSKNNSNGAIVLTYKDPKSAFHMQLRHVKALNCQKHDIQTSKPENSGSAQFHEALQMLPANLSEKLDPETYSELVSVMKAVTTEDQNSKCIDVSVEEEDTEHLQSESSSTQNEQINTLSLTDKDVQCILSALITDDQVKRVLKWTDTSVPSLRNHISSAQNIVNEFTLVELKTVVRTLKQLHPKSMKGVMLSQNKVTLAIECSKRFGCTTLTTNKTISKMNCLSLRQLAIRAVNKLPKMLLNIVYAEMNWADVVADWQQSFPFSAISTFSDVDCVPIEWFSYPERFIHETGEKVVFGVVDSHHILTNLRSKCCSSGIPDCGIKREAWYKVAKDNKTNGTGLSLAHVDGLIDRQSNAFAKKTFSYEVETCMRENGDLTEAMFCELIRRWYEADDEPQISSRERLFIRLRLRNWLLSKYKEVFPPPGMYVSGIPIVTYESLMTSIERRIQLYACVQTGTYNTRAVSTLDAENFFSLFEELHPTGGGALRPDVVTKCLRTACQLSAIRSDPERSFSMSTSRAPVYPVHQFQQHMDTNSVSDDDANDSRAGWGVIKLRDHPFDCKTTKTKARKRKSGEISQPREFSRGERGVRDHHRRNEAKILPHIRLGISVD